MEIANVTSSIKNGTRTKVTFDLDPDGIRNVRITAPNPEARDDAMERLRRVLPWFELLEAELVRLNSGAPGEKRPHV
jgi:hypothetical protein